MVQLPLEWGADVVVTVQPRFQIAGIGGQPVLGVGIQRGGFLLGQPLPAIQLVENLVHLRPLVEIGAVLETGLTGEEGADQGVLGRAPRPLLVDLLGDGVVPLARLEGGLARVRHRHQIGIVPPVRAVEFGHPQVEHQVEHPQITGAGIGLLDLLTTEILFSDVLAHPVPEVVLERIQRIANRREVLVERAKTLGTRPVDDAADHVPGAAGVGDIEHASRPAQRHHRSLHERRERAQIKHPIHDPFAILPDAGHPHVREHEHRDQHSQRIEEAHPAVPRPHEPEPRLQIRGQVQFLGPFFRLLIGRCVEIDKQRILRRDLGVQGHRPAVPVMEEQDLGERIVPVRPPADELVAPDVAQDVLADVLGLLLPRPVDEGVVVERLADVIHVEVAPEADEHPLPRIGVLPQPDRLFPEGLDHIHPRLLEILAVEALAQ